MALQSLPNNLPSPSMGPFRIPMGPFRVPEGEDEGGGEIPLTRGGGEGD